MRGSTLVYCNYCGKQFKIKNSQLRRGRGRFCSLDCKSKSQVGKITSPKALFQKGQIPWNKGKHYPQPKQRGKLHSQWKGGVTRLQTLLRNSLHNKMWRMAVFQRDDYTCQKCNVKGGELEAHHKVPFANILQIHNIRTVEQGFQCEDLWDINNGITECKECHRYKFHRFKQPMMGGPGA